MKIFSMIRRVKAAFRKKSEPSDSYTYIDQIKEIGHNNKGKEKYLFLIFPLLIILITSLISFANYAPHTWLTGWDTLHPEFNFGLNIRNMIFGIFRSDQGLGAVAAHAHMSDLPRVIILWIFSHLLPLSFLRYFYIFLCFILGPLGIFYFVKSIIAKSTLLTSSLAGFLAALFYVFNLGTVQHFFVPFEMFMTQYAALGWLFLTATQYLFTKQKKYLALFMAFTLLATPMAYAFVLWYAYFAALILFCGTLYLLERKKISLKSVLVLCIATLMLNAFWILPNLYFVKHSAPLVPNAQTNRIFSEEAFLHNKEYGNIFDAIVFKNYLFNWREVNSNQPLLVAWTTHLASPWTRSIGYLGFIGVLLGMVAAIRKKHKVALALVPLTLVSLIMIINMNPPFEFFFGWIRDHISLFKEGLRFPFTKFSILMMFSFSAYFGLFFAQLFSTLSKIIWPHLTRTFQFGSALLVALLLVWYGFPMFQGALISKDLRVDIPQQYFQFYQWMETQPESARVATLPMHSLWGWEYYDWGYQGAGFLWFGLKQPVLARDFDRWEPQNEQFYREMSTALYDRDPHTVDAIATKYNIGFFVLDESVIAPGSKPNVLWSYETRDTFAKSSHIHLVKQFGTIKVYKVDTNTSFIAAPVTYGITKDLLTGGYYDAAATDIGTYIVSNAPTTIYPTRNLVNRYGEIDPSKVLVSPSSLVLKLDGKIPSFYDLSSNWEQTPDYSYAFREQPDLVAQEESATPFRQGENLYISIPLNEEPTTLKNALHKNQLCDKNTPSQNGSMVTKEDLVSFTSVNGQTCSYIPFPNQHHDLGGIVIIEARNVKGLPLRLCITDNISDRCDVYTTFDEGSEWKRYYFMIPPLQTGSSGYAVNFNNVSIGETESQNEIRLVQFVVFPYERIQKLKLVKDGSTSGTTNNSISVTSSTEVNPLLFTATVKKNTEAGLGVVSSAKTFDTGWQAYQIETKEGFSGFIQTVFPQVFGQKINSHIRVNNWENGWIVFPDSTMKIVIVYTPQYLEYAGFAVLGASWIVLLVTLLPIRLVKQRK